VKPSDKLKNAICSPADEAMLDIIDQMAEDIARLKFLVKYTCSSDVLKVYPIKEREWEE
jgi:hypothetical protein